MKTVSVETWIFARDAVREEIEEMLDDPSYLLEEPERLALLKRVADNLELDYDKLIAEYGTPFEIDRLKKLEQQIEHRGTGTED